MLPYVIIHNALSVDGRMDWITPDLGQFYQIAASFKEDATLVGSETLLDVKEEIPEEDNSVFEAFEIKPDDTRPILVVPDTKGKIRTWHFWKKQPYWKKIIVLCSSSTPEEYQEFLKKRHIEYIITGETKANMREVLEKLNTGYGVQVIRVDSGGTLNGVLIKEGLVNEVSILLEPCMVGGTSPKSLYIAPDLTSQENIIKLKLKHFEKFPNNVIWLRYTINN